MSITDRLILISKLKPGDTINASTNEIVRHNSWYAWMTRYSSGDNRAGTVTWVQTAVDNVLFSLANIHTEVVYQATIEQLTASTNGIRNLISTYSECEDTTRQLWKLTDRIECRVAAETRSYCRVCLTTHVDRSGSVQVRRAHSESFQPRSY